MASLVFGMHVSLDGYVDHTAFAPPPGLFRPPATPAVQREQGRCRDPPGGTAHGSGTTFARRGVHPEARVLRELSEWRCRESNPGPTVKIRDFSERSRCACSWPSYFLRRCRKHGHSHERCSADPRDPSRW